MSSESVFRPQGGLLGRDTWPGEYFLSSNNMCFPKVTCIIQWIYLATIYLSLSIFKNHSQSKIQRARNLWISWENIWFSHVLILCVQKEHQLVTYLLSTLLEWEWEDNSFCSFLSIYIFTSSKPVVSSFITLKCSFTPMYLFIKYCMFLLVSMTRVYLAIMLNSFQLYHVTVGQHRGIDFYISVSEVHTQNYPLKIELSTANNNQILFEMCLLGCSTFS